MILEVNGLSKTFGDNQVIQDFDFQIDKGEIVVLAGGSGTGKTTFLRMINNLEEADSGSISINGTYLIKDDVIVDSKGQREYQNKIGLVFQSYQLFPHLNVMDNLLEGPLAQDLDSRENLQVKALDLLTKMGIGNKAQAMPSTLSGGQAQRVAIARAMMLEPAILCFDEPTSALDADSSKSIGLLIEEIASDGTGVLIVTHDIEFGKIFGTRLVHSREFI